MINLSIIIVSFNTKELTLECIKSIVDSKPKLSFEIIVVDNASTDGSVEAIRKISNKFKLILIENKKNIGFAKANNQGINIAKGNAVLLLNSDTIINLGVLDSLHEFAQKNSDAGVVVPQLLNADGSVQASVFRLPTIIRSIKQYWLGIGKILDKYTPAEKEPLVVESAVAAVFLITRRALDTVGGLNEKYFMFFEDLDYCRSINRVGLKVYYVPSIKVTHYHGASGKKLAKSNDQWRRLIPSSKLYHGVLRHYLINFILWSGQKLRKI